MAQEIQWASGVVAESNAFGAGEYGSKQALGQPDAFPYGELSPKAFRLSGEGGSGSLTLSFTVAQNVRQVVMFENFKPGRVKRVSLLDENGMRYVILDESFEEPKDYYVRTIPVPRIEQRFNRIEILFDASNAPGWTQLDAVGISANDDPSFFRELMDRYQLAESYKRLESRQIKTNLGHFINTKFHENKPIISADGNRLYFGRMYYPGNIGGSMDVQDVYVSEKINGEWSEPKNLQPPINNPNPNGMTSVSADGNRLYLINEYLPDGTFRDGFSYADRTSSGWSKPQIITIENYANRSTYLDFALSVNEDVIILAVETGDSYGDQDLYVCFYLGDNRWSEPQNLGPTLNTPKAEFAPFLAPDGNTLYFSSDGHGGFGDADIYYTKRLDDSWRVWTEPQNLGADINTKNLDAYFTIPANSSIGYYVSTDKSIGGSRDIFAIELQPEFLPDPIVAFQGLIRDAETGAPLQAPVNLRSSDDTAKRSAIVSNPEDGGFKAILVQKSSYTVEVQLDGYLPFSLPVGPYQFDGDTTIVKEILLKPLEKIVAIPSQIVVRDKVNSSSLTATLQFKVQYPEDSVVTFQLNSSTASEGKVDFEVLSNAMSIEALITAEGYSPLSLSLSVEEAADGQILKEIFLSKLMTSLGGSSKLSSLPRMEEPNTPSSLSKVELQDPILPNGKYIWMVTLTDAVTGEPITGTVMVRDSLNNSLLEVPVAEDQYTMLSFEPLVFRSLMAERSGYEPSMAAIQMGDLLFQDQQDTLVFELVPLPEASYKQVRLRDAYTGQDILQGSLDWEILYGADSTSKASYTEQGLADLSMALYEGASELNLRAKADNYQRYSYSLSSPYVNLIDSAALILYLVPVPSAIAKPSIIPSSPMPLPSNQLNPREVPILELEAPALIVEFMGMVFNEATGEEVESGSFLLTVINQAQQIAREGEFSNGRFTSPISAGSQVKATVSAKGYLKSERTFEIADSLNLFEAIFSLAPIEKGKAVDIPNLLFALQSDEIVPVSFPVLDSIANVMVANESIEILLSGHTDVIGDKELNFQLSLDRANAVKEYLVSKGVLPERIRVEAFGGAKPIASSGREVTRRLNRRVEITIIKN